ncbi:MAG: lamin tail domain-containing protein [Planctomycetota bacterium]|nr:lamin tail domain-containing protein [Planctomycetota bacterium]
MRNPVLRLSLLLAIFASGLNAQVAINEYCNDPYASAPGLDTNLDGSPATSSSQSDDEFVEIVNFGAASVDIGNWTLSDFFGLRHTFAGGTLLGPGSAVVVFGGGSVANFNSLGLSGVTADTGALGLNNTSDSIILVDSMGVTVDSHSYSSGGPGDGNGESITRVPESATGVFTLYTTFAGINHSAGYMLNGTSPWGPAVFPGTGLPGTGEDIALETGVNAATSGGAGNDVKTALGGDVLTVYVDSSGGTFVAQPLVLAADLTITGFPLMGFLPSVHVSSSFIVLIDGLSPTAVGTPTLSFGGTTVSYVLPMGLTGQSIILQAAAVGSAAANGNYASTDAHEIQMQ